MNATTTTPRIFAGLGVLLLALLPLALGGCGEADPYEIPVSPFQVIGRVPLPSENEGVASLGDYAFVAGGQAGLHVIDMSVPGAPVLVTTVNTTKYAESVEVVRTLVGGELRDVALVVEGVETTAERDLIAALGARYVQGYVYSRPLPPAQLESFTAEAVVPPGRSAARPAPGSAADTQPAAGVGLQHGVA